VCMTYCLALRLDGGLVFMSDTRTNAGVDNVSNYRKLHILRVAPDRIFVLQSAGNLATTQEVLDRIHHDLRGPAGTESLATVNEMYEAALYLGRLSRTVVASHRDGLMSSGADGTATFILGGQISGEPMRLFRIYAEGNFIEAGADTPYFQTGETKYGKPILDRVVDRSTSLDDAAKCVLVSFDSTMRSNLSVAMPIDLICYERDALAIRKRRRFEQGDPDFGALSKKWSEGVRAAFRELPGPRWGA